LVSKQDLMARVWPNVFVEPAKLMVRKFMDRKLMVHVSALHRRCGTLHRQHSGRGYCFFVARYVD